MAAWEWLLDWVARNHRHRLPGLTLDDHFEHSLADGNQCRDEATPLYMHLVGEPRVHVHVFDFRVKANDRSFGSVASDSSAWPRKPSRSGLGIRRRPANPVSMRPARTPCVRL